MSRLQVPRPAVRCGTQGRCRGGAGGLLAPAGAQARRRAPLILRAAAQLLSRDRRRLRPIDGAELEAAAALRRGAAPPTAHRIPARLAAAAARSERRRRRRQRCRRHPRLEPTAALVLRTPPAPPLPDARRPAAAEGRARGRRADGTAGGEDSERRELGLVHRAGGRAEAEAVGARAAARRRGRELERGCARGRPCGSARPTCHMEGGVSAGKASLQGGARARFRPPSLRSARAGTTSAGPPDGSHSARNVSVHTDVATMLLRTRRSICGQEQRHERVTKCN